MVFFKYLIYTFARLKIFSYQRYICLKILYFSPEWTEFRYISFLTFVNLTEVIFQIKCLLMYEKFIRRSTDRAISVRYFFLRRDKHFFAVVYNSIWICLVFMRPLSICWHSNVRCRTSTRALFRKGEWDKMV